MQMKHRRVGLSNKLEKVKIYSKKLGMANISYPRLIVLLIIGIMGGIIKIDHDDFNFNFKIKIKIN